MRPLRPGPRRRDPARLQPSSCRSPRASGRRPLRASDPDRHLPRPDPGGDRPFSTSTALRAPSVCSRRHPRHPRQSPIHQPRPSAPPEPDHQIPIARRLEDRGFVLRGLSDACQRPKLFTEAERLLPRRSGRKLPFVAPGSPRIPTALPRDRGGLSEPSGVALRTGTAHDADSGAGIWGMSVKTHSHSCNLESLLIKILTWC